MSDLRAMLGKRYPKLTTAISATVSDWIGHDTPYNPHHWRCEDYPGPCGHDGEMAGEVMAVLGDILPGLLAQAWEEGFYAGVAADMGDWEHPPEIIPNPYRPEPNDEHTPLPENDPKDDERMNRIEGNHHEG